MPRLLRLAPLALLLASVLPAAARPAALAAVSSVVFETRGEMLTVRVRASSRVQAYSAERRGRTVTLTLMGAALAPSMDRGRAALPVRDYRVEASGDRVVLTFDAPDCPDPQVGQDAADVLLTFSAPPRAAGWGGGGWGARRAPEERRAEAPPVQTARTETPRSARTETPRVATPAVQMPVATATRRAPTRRTRRDPAPQASPQPTAAEAPAAAPPSASAWQTAPPAIVPMTPEASAVYIANGSNWRLDTIVLDAGHGGNDAGGVGIGGVTDRDVAFGVVQRLGPMIERELGIRVVYTRSTNTFVELRDRGRIANQAGGKLFISVHGNSGPASASGTETFFLAARGSGVAREVMERENSVIELESNPSFYNGYTGAGDIMASLAMSAYQEESQTLARLVEHEFVSAGRRSRGVKQNNFMVLWGASMPAILCEVGFVTNPEEARLLSSSAGLDQTARALFNAVAAYRDQYERGLRLAAAG